MRVGIGTWASSPKLKASLMAGIYGAVRLMGFPPTKLLSGAGLMKGKASALGKLDNEGGAGLYWLLGIFWLSWMFVC